MNHTVTGRIEKKILITMPKLANNSKVPIE